MKALKSKNITQAYNGRKKQGKSLHFQKVTVRGKSAYIVDIYQFVIVVILQYNARAHILSSSKWVATW